MHLSSHLTDLSIASFTRGPVVVGGTTSSRAIIISEPILFYISIDLSGVSLNSLPSICDLKLTPSSSNEFNSPRETI